MNVKKSLENRIRGWLPKGPEMPKQPQAPSFKRTEFPNKKGLLDRTLPAKPSANLANGVGIGGSATVLLVTLSLWYALNSNYWSLRSQMLFAGLNSSDANLILLGQVTVISICSGVAVYSGYLLLFFCARELSPVFRHFMDWDSKLSDRIGLAFITGGTIAFSASLMTAVSYSYPGESLGPPLYLIWGIVGAVLSLTGILLTIYSWLKIRRSIVKPSIS